MAAAARVGALWRPSDLDRVMLRWEALEWVMLWLEMSGWEMLGREV